MSKTILLFSLLVAVPLIGLAQEDNDPRILLAGGDDGPQPVQNIGNVQPACTDGGISGSTYLFGLVPLPTCTYNFQNTSGSILTSFTFETQVNANLPFPNLLFNCDQQGLGYFLNCNVMYNSSSGDLKYVFSGVNPSDGDETPGPGFDNQYNEQEGIPPTGLFHITLVNWSPAFDGVLWGNQLPTLTNSFTTVPEASSIVILLTELLLLAAFLTLFRRKLNWKRLLDR